MWSEAQAESTWIQFHAFSHSITEEKSPKSRRFLHLLIPDPAGWNRGTQWKLQLSVWEVSQEAESQWHMQRRSSQGGHQNQVWSIAAYMLMLHPGVWHLDYLGFKVLGCPTESAALSSKHRLQSYCLPALGGLWVCSDAGVQPVKRESISYILVQGKCQKSTLTSAVRNKYAACVAATLPDPWDLVYTGN